MTKHTEVMKLALEALKSCDAAHITDGGRQWYDEKLVDKAVEAIEKAQASEAKEQPAQRTWVGLTDEEKTEIRRKTYALPLLLMEAIEAKLKEKNT